MSQYLALLAISAATILSTTNAQFFGGGYGGGFGGYNTGFSGYGNTNTGYNTGYGTGYSNSNVYGNTYGNNGYSNGYTNTNNGYITNNGYTTNHGYNTNNGYTNTGYGNNYNSNTGIGSSSYGPTITTRTGNTRAPVSTSVEVPITNTMNLAEPTHGLDNRGRVMHFFSTIDDDSIEYDELDTQDEEILHHEKLKKIEKIHPDFFDHPENPEHNLYLDAAISLEEYTAFLSQAVEEKEHHIHALNFEIAKKIKKLSKLAQKEDFRREKLSLHIDQLLKLQEKLEKTDEMEEQVEWERKEAEKKDRRNFLRHQRRIAKELEDYHEEMLRLSEEEKKEEEKCILEWQNEELLKKQLKTNKKRGKKEKKITKLKFLEDEHLVDVDEELEEEHIPVNTLNFNSPYPGM